MDGQTGGEGVDAQPEGWTDSRGAGLSPTLGAEKPPLPPLGAGPGGAGAGLSPGVPAARPRGRAKRNSREIQPSPKPPALIGSRQLFPRRRDTHNVIRPGEIRSRRPPARGPAGPDTQRPPPALRRAAPREPAPQLSPGRPPQRVRCRGLAIKAFAVPGHRAQPSPAAPSALPAAPQRCRRDSRPLEPGRPPPCAGRLGGASASGEPAPRRGWKTESSRLCVRAGGRAQAALMDRGLRQPCWVLVAQGDQWMFYMGETRGLLGEAGRSGHSQLQQVQPTSPPPHTQTPSNTSTQPPHAQPPTPTDSRTSVAQEHACEQKHTCSSANRIPRTFRPRSEGWSDTSQGTRRV